MGDDPEPEIARLRAANKELFEIVYLLVGVLDNDGVVDNGLLARARAAVVEASEVT